MKPNNAMRALIRKADAQVTRNGGQPSQEEQASIRFSERIRTCTSEKPMPPIHITTYAALRAISASGNFLVPAGASFSPWDHGATGRHYSVSERPVAIRITPGLLSRSGQADAKYRFRPDGVGAGLIPEASDGKKLSKIPSIDLQFFSQTAGQWYSLAPPSRRGRQ